MKRALRSFLGFAASMLSLIAAKAIMLSLVALFSLAMTIASFTIPALANLAYRAATLMPFRAPAVLSPTESRNLAQQNRQLTQQNRRLQASNTELSTRNHQLNERNRQLRTANQNLESQATRQRRVAANSADRIKRRSAQLATRSIAAIPAESIPILGVTTIIATTAWDLSDACKTVRDMGEIQSSLGVDPDEGMAAWVCEKLNLRGERVNLYQNMTAAQCRMEAKAARDRVLDLARSSRDEIPDLVSDTHEFDSEIMQVAQAEHDEINAICDCIADLTCNLDDLTSR